MEFKISIIDATPEELAQVFANIQSIQSGSTTVVETKTKNLDLTAKPGPVKVEESEEDDDAKTVLMQDQLENEGASKAEEEKPKRTRRSKAQIEAEEAAARADKKSAPARSRDDDEEEEPVKKREATPNLVNQMVELAEKLDEEYENSEKVLRNILKVFGVETLADVAPADRTAVIQAIRAKLD